MSDPRAQHVGKTRFEKENYGQMLNTQQPEAPTFEEQETASTNTVYRDNAADSKVVAPGQKPYTPASPHPVLNKILLNILLPVISGAVLLFFGYCSMDFNRELGVLGEKAAAATTQRAELKAAVERLETNITEIEIDVEVIKRLFEQRGSGNQE